MSPVPVRVSRPPDLPPLDVAARLDRLRASLGAAGVPGLLVTHRPNVRYLTGFTGSAGMLLVPTDADAVLVTDGRYAEQATGQVREAGVPAEIEVAATQVDQHRLLAGAAHGLGRLGLEAHAVTWAVQRALSERLAPVEIVPTEGLVEALRRVKDAGEVARIRAACAVADEALAEVLPVLAERPTEAELALALEVAMRRRGASGPSFETIVASGPNSSRPHARPSDRVVGPAELVVIDFGCVVDGYCSDCTRTVSVGDPGDDARRLHRVVLDAQRAGREAVRAGAECAAIDRAARSVIEAAGLGEAFPHSTGHGLGLEVHEAPRLASTSRDTVAAGSVVTVEPGVYLPGTGGVRIEDTVVVTDEGAESLTASPKDLVL